MDFQSKDLTSEASRIDIPVAMSANNDGEGTVLGCTTLFEHNEAVKSIFYVEDSQGERKVLTSTDKDIFKNLGEQEWVGKKIRFKNNQVY